MHRYPLRMNCLLELRFVFSDDQNVSLILQNVVNQQCRNIVDEHCLLQTLLSRYKLVFLLHRL